MKGQLLNNKQIDDLVNQGIIEISPDYDLSKLQIAQYPLSPSVIWEIDKNHKLIKAFQFDNEKTGFHLKPQTYYLIDINEKIILPWGIVGRFIPSSIFIEKGISIITGKIEYPYGQNGERVRFGVYNFLNIETTIEISDRIAYIEFFDLRGEESLKYDLSRYDKNIYSERIGRDDDGPNYEIDNSD